MALTNRYASVIKGGLTVTGNTLVIRPNTASPPSTPSYVTGAFISTNTSNVVTGYPVGTTRTASAASSSAVLNIPTGSTVVFAQLFWILSGSSNANAAITFTTPLRSLNITPTLSDDTSTTGAWRGADVTNTINTDGSGTYTIGNVNSSVPNGSNIATCNWSLVVVYSNPSMPYKYININTGSQDVSNSSQANFTFSGFSTPTTGPLAGYFIATCSNGDLVDGAEIRVGAATANTRIGNNSSPWNNLAPYCRIGNMATANILIADTNDPNIGFLDTRGSFGTYNTDPYNNSVPTFGRVLYDLIGVDISNTLVNGQTQLKTNITFTGTGSATFSSQSIQVQLNSSEFGSTLYKTVDKSFADIGDVLTYTINFKNTGLSAASNVLFMDTTPIGTVFLNNSLYIDGVQSSRTNIGPSTPINFGTVASNEAHTISYKVAVTTIPTTFKINNIGSLNYKFQLGAGLSTISDTINTNVVSTTINYINSPIINSALVTATYTLYPTLPNGEFLATDSNYTVTQINTATLVSSKYYNKNYAGIGDILTYTISLTNIGNVTAKDVIISDTAPQGTKILLETVRIDGALSNKNPEPPGFNFGDILVNQTRTLSYNVLVYTTPSPNYFSNSALIQWSYTVDPSLPRNNSLSNNTNSVVTTINYPFINTTKYVDKRYATWNDILTYTIRVQNSGTTIANGIVYKDTVPSGTSYVANSLYINGVSSTNSLNSIYIGNLDVNAIATIVFKVKVT